ncbi:MAG: hypothetical protein EXQ95_01670 [Alphaproteobacteria bacterium]|nr:hypothetical protein [Alphaproteobacteria bacterium]
MRRLALLMSTLLLAAPGETLTGTIVDTAGQPVEGARVRLRTSTAFVLSGPDGRFTLADPAAAPGREITAARPGHIIGGVTLKEGIFHYTLALPAIPEGDDATYPWVTAFPEDDRAPRTDFGREPCGACHRRILAEWQGSAHARSAVNPRFLAFFGGGTDPSFKRDSPTADGGCATCHVPMAGDGDPRQAAGVAGEGVGCDVCHKIAEARPGNGAVTGIRAVDLRRPPFGRQTVFGPFDDVPRGRDAFAPVYAESRYCAACHQARIGGVPIYSEFEEWRASRFAGAGVTCQTCHMRGDGRATTMSDLGPGRIERDPRTLSSHRFHDSRSPDLLAGAIKASLTTERDGRTLIVAFEITNHEVGHHLPAGSPMRHMLVSIEAEADGQALELIDGPVLPHWTGSDLAGKPGRTYAKLLRDLAGDAAHPAPPWRAVVLESDTRIPAGGEDRSTYRFRLEGTGPIRIGATVRIRRTFPAWAEAHGLDIGEIEVARHNLTVSR